MLKNNLIVLLFAAAGLFSSCGNVNRYSITGSLPARYDGLSLRLPRSISQRRNPVRWIVSKSRMVSFGLPERYRNRQSI